MLRRRIEVFTALPFDSVDAVSLKARLREIGRLEGATPMAQDAT